MTAERRTGADARPRPLVVAMVVVVFGSLLIVAVSAAALLGAAALLVWVTGVVGSWLGLPATPLLVAVIGIAMCVLVLIACGRIVEAIRKPFKMLGDLTDVDDPDNYDYEDEDEEGSDDGEGVTSSARRRT